MGGLPRGLVRRKGSDVIWVNVYYRLPGDLVSRRFYRSTRERSVRKAEEYLMDIRRAIRDGTFAEKFLNISEKTLMLSDALNWYMANFVQLNTVREKNRRDTERILRDFLECCGDKPVMEYRRIDVEKYRMDRLARGNTQSSINRHLGAIGGMFSRLARKDLIAHNPLQGKIEYFPKAQPRDRYATPEELGRILAGVQHEEFRLIILVALFSGMRLSNITGLRRENVDLERGAFEFVQVKRRPGDPVKKNVVPIATVLAPPLSKWIAGLKTDRLFSLESWTVTNMWIAKMRELGIPGLRFHDLRRTLATYLRNNTESDMFLIQRILGHSQPTMTDAVYAVTEVEKKRRAIDKALEGDWFQMLER